MPNGEAPPEGSPPPGGGAPPDGAGSPGEGTAPNRTPPDGAAPNGATPGGIAPGSTTSGGRPGNTVPNTSSPGGVQPEPPGELSSQAAIRLTLSGEEKTIRLNNDTMISALTESGISEIPIENIAVGSILCVVMKGEKVLSIRVE